MKLSIMVTSIIFASSLVFAANTVPDGTFSGTGTWTSSGPNGTIGGSLEQSWTQNGIEAHNHGDLKLQGQVVQSFDDEYQFIALQGVNYRMDRMINGQYIPVGACTQSPAGYSCSINQATPQGNLSVTESGFMQDNNTLVRIGTMTAADGTVITYSATLVRQ